MTPTKKARSPSRRRYCYRNPPGSLLPKRIASITSRGAAYHRRLKTICDRRLIYDELTYDEACQLFSDLKFEPTEVHVAEIRRRFFCVWQNYLKARRRSCE